MCNDVMCVKSMCLVKVRLFAVQVCMYIKLRSMNRNESEAIYFALAQNFPWYTQDTQYVHRYPHEIRNAFFEGNNVLSKELPLNLSIQEFKATNYCDCRERNQIPAQILASE